jgi:formylmethanofuran dehydrogenase subunit E
MIMPSSKSDSKTKKKKRRENCGQGLQEDEVYKLDGMILCFDCYNE